MEPKQSLKSIRSEAEQSRLASQRRRNERKSHLIEPGYRLWTFLIASGVAAGVLGVLELLK